MKADFKILLPIFFLIVLSNTCFGQANTIAQNFSLKNLQDDTYFNLAHYKNYPCVVLIFTSAYCPYTRSYKDRITELAQKYTSGQKVKFILINPEGPKDSMEQMKKSAQSFQLPYLFDPGQKITKQYKATKTPEAFVLQGTLGHFVIKYHGAIDDKPSSADEVQRKYLQEAIQAALENRNLGSVNQEAVGCIID